MLVFLPPNLEIFLLHHIWEQACRPEKYLCGKKFFSLSTVHLQYMLIFLLETIDYQFTHLSYYESYISLLIFVLLITEYELIPMNIKYVKSINFYTIKRCRFIVHFKETLQIKPFPGNFLFSVPWLFFIIILQKLILQNKILLELHLGGII